MAEVTTQLTKVDAKVDRIWIRISVVVLTLMAAGGFIQWALLTYKLATQAGGG